MAILGEMIIGQSCLRGTVGVQLNRATVYTGYDFLDVGRSQTHGLIGGGELWF